MPPTAVTQNHYEDINQTCECVYLTHTVDRVLWSWRVLKQAPLAISICYANLNMEMKHRFPQVRPILKTVDQLVQIKTYVWLVTLDWFEVLFQSEYKPACCGKNKMYFCEWSTVVFFNFNVIVDSVLSIVVSCLFQKKNSARSQDFSVNFVTKQNMWCQRFLHHLNRLSNI